jgi:hypothetical protein
MAITRMPTRRRIRTSGRRDRIGPGIAADTERDPSRPNRCHRSVPVHRHSGRQCGAASRRSRQRVHRQESARVERLADRAQLARAERAQLGLAVSRAGPRLHEHKRHTLAVCAASNTRTPALAVLVETPPEVPRPAQVMLSAIGRVRAERAGEMQQVHRARQALIGEGARRITARRLSAVSASAYAYQRTTSMPARRSSRAPEFPAPYRARNASPGEVGRPRWRILEDTPTKGHKKALPAGARNQFAGRCKGLPPTRCEKVRTCENLIG